MHDPMPRDSEAVRRHISFDPPHSIWFRLVEDEFGTALDLGPDEHLIENVEDGQLYADWVEAREEAEFGFD